MSEDEEGNQLHPQWERTIVLPHSAHIMAPEDWPLYIASIRSMVIATEAAAASSGSATASASTPVAVAPAAAAAAAADAAAALPPASALAHWRPPHPLSAEGGSSVAVEEDAALPGRLAAMRLTLLQLESSSDVEVRSYPYLGRLFSFKESPPGGLKQIDPATLALTPGDDWGVIQAVCDVWYVGVMLGLNTTTVNALKPPTGMITRLVAKLNRDWALQRPGSLDLIMWYIVGKSLDRLNAGTGLHPNPGDEDNEGAGEPGSTGDSGSGGGDRGTVGDRGGEGGGVGDGVGGGGEDANSARRLYTSWRDVAKAVSMRERFPAMYMYLCTHVYLYNSDFGTLPFTVEAIPSAAARGLILDAAEELVEMVPLVMERRGYDRVFKGMVAEREGGDGGGQEWWCRKRPCTTLCARSCLR